MLNMRGSNFRFQRWKIGAPNALHPDLLMNTNSMNGSAIDVNAATYPLRGTEIFVCVQPAVGRESAATAG